jgi:hypothetical protein
MVVLGSLGICVVALGLIWLQYGLRPRRLAARTEIEVPIPSMGRTALILAPSMVLPPALGLTVLLLDGESSQHAVALTLVPLGLCFAGIFAGLSLARRYARVGVLRYTPHRLELVLGDERCHVDLDQPYELDEARAFAPGDNDSLQVVRVREGARALAFSYGLAAWRTPYGGITTSYLPPILDGEASAIHDRLRQRLGR